MSGDVIAAARARTPVSRVRRITVRQREIIGLLEEPGATQDSVAEQLGISTSTVKGHLQAAYRALDVRTLAQASRALRAVRKG